MTTPSPGALRMRRSRERRLQGDVIAKLEIGPNMTADLAELGWLPGPDRVDKDALGTALLALIRRAIRARVTPARDSEEDNLCFLCELKPSTIKTLVHLGWLRADQQDDLAAIVIGFRRFAGRSLEIARNSP